MINIEQFLGLKKGNRIFGLDLLRSIAILLVLFAHGDFILKENLHNFNGIIKLDGVDFFFVLSGFLIGGILIKKLNEKKTFNILEFWKNRWLRTLPNYFLILIVLLCYHYYHLNGSFTFDYRYLFFTQNLVTPNPSFFPESWSLSVEEWFYLVFPICVGLFLFLTKNKKNALLSAIILLFVFSMSYKIYKSFQFEVCYSNYDMYFRKIVFARLDSLSIGVLAAYILSYYPNVFYSKIKLKLILGLCLIISTTILPLNVFFLVFNTIVLSFGVFFCLPALMLLKNYPNYIGSIVLYISAISYSLYLIHFSIVLWIIVGVTNQYSYFDVTFDYLSYFFISIILSTINYKFFEIYFLNLRNRKINFFKRLNN